MTDRSMRRACFATARTLRCARTFSPDWLDLSSVSRDGTEIKARKNVTLLARVLKARVENGQAPGESWTLPIPLRRPA